MPDLLRTLIIEDLEGDAELLVRALQRGGYDVKYRRVHTAQAMQAALDESAWDIVISDYSMPAFSGSAALDILQLRGIDIPFILVSGAVGETAAVAALKAGAHDFVPKDNLARLVPAVARELRDAGIRREHGRARQKLQESEQKLRLFVEYAPSAIAMFDRDMRYVAFSRRWLSDYDLGEQDLTGRSHYDVFPDLPERWKKIHRRCLAGAVEKCNEDPFPRTDGSVDWVRWEVHPWQDGEGRIGGIIIFSEVITERKQAQDALLRNAEEMRSLSQRLSEVEENERRNIHRELHDQIGANLAALKLDLDIISSALPQDALRAIGDRLQKAQHMAGETISRIRDVMADLRPPALDDFGLLAALRMHAKPLAARLGVPIDVEGEDIEPRPALAIETALFRIAQEALNNVVKHARARQVRIAVVAEINRVALLITDDGAGFDPVGLDRQHTSWGLRTMHERAQAIGADLRVESAPGKGTRVIVDLPREAA